MFHLERLRKQKKSQVKTVQYFKSNCINALIRLETKSDRQIIRKSVGSVQ